MQKSLFVLLIAAGCGNSPQAPQDLGAQVDLSHEPIDLSAPSSPIGGPCANTAQCFEGKTPVCFVSKLYNKAGYLGTPNGYCSSRCVDSSECGAAGSCIDLGSDGKWCMASCTVATDCRSAGYACFRYQGGYCFPSGYLNCDPTVPGGACTTKGTNLPGGCLRDAVGPGVTGYCSETCTAGAGSCSYANGARQCVVFDQTGSTDLQGNKTGDQFHGGICIYSYSMNTVGTECKSIASDGTVHDYLDACVDGAECYSKFFTGGDNLCHVMCLQNGNPDAGAPVCPAGQACADIFKLFGTANPIGLCK